MPIQRQENNSESSAWFGPQERLAEATEEQETHVSPDMEGRDAEWRASRAAQSPTVTRVPVRDRFGWPRAVPALQPEQTPCPPPTSTWPFCFAAQGPGLVLGYLPHWERVAADLASVSQALAAGVGP